MCEIHVQRAGRGDSCCGLSRNQGDFFFSTLPRSCFAVFGLVLVVLSCFSGFHQEYPGAKYQLEEKKQNIFSENWLVRWLVVTSVFGRSLAVFVFFCGVFFSLKAGLAWRWTNLFFLRALFSANQSLRGVFGVWGKGI